MGQARGIVPARAVTGGRASARAANNYWEKPETLAGHYADHGEGVGATSKEEYTRMTHEFYLNRAQHLVKVSDKGVK